MSIYEKYKYSKADDKLSELEEHFKAVERGEFVGASRVYYTDAHAYEVIGVTASRKTITIRRMNATMTVPPKLNSIGGFVANFDNYTQEWVYESDTEGHVIKARLRQNGTYYAEGDTRVYIGKPHEFRDNNF